MTVLLLELNEINFNHVREYIKLGKLPNLANLLNQHLVLETTSEKNYHELEPWIQWVTAHTGLSLAEHRVFRLGDIIDHDLPQIWDVLEMQGLRVGAVSPMNAKNRCQDAAFFLPDPWTQTRVTGSVLMKCLSDAVSQTVNDNASGRITLRSAFYLTAGLIAYARPNNYSVYLKIVWAILSRRPWAGALLLDQLLSDLFVRAVIRKKPDFASLFLNAGAHIQHHYMFNAQVYSGLFKNPRWYVDPKADPVFDVYSLYDRVVGQLQEALPNARLMIATGLHQDPHHEVTFYWRLKDHADFLKQANVRFDRLEPRMSRDFILYFSDSQDAAIASSRIKQIRSTDGTAFFEVDDRGDSLFVTLVWAHDLPESVSFFIGNDLKANFRQHVAFVAIKNGEHNSVGYFVDTGVNERTGSGPIPLSSLPRIIANACGAKWPKHLS